MGLSLICPTIGRTTLRGVIDSAGPQLHKGDELIIIGDGPLSVEAYEIILKAVENSAGLIRYMELPSRVGDYACTPCDTAIKKAKGSHVFFIGDDDLVAEGAFEVIRTAVLRDPHVPHLFAMWHTNRVLANSIEPCQVSGQQIVVPRDLTLMPKMADCDPAQILVSDWVFIDKVHRAWGGKTVFHDDIIALLTKQNFGVPL